MTSTPRAGYLARNPALLAWLRFTEALLRRTVRAPAVAAPMEPRRVLVCVGGHYGDAVLASAAIDALARAFPAAELGVMAGDAGLTVLRGLPRVRWTHRAEHWRTVRPGGALATRWLRALRLRRRAVRELRAVGYDAAVDLSAHYPNMASLAWRAGIPYRLGFASGGFGALFTEALPWEPGAAHEVERQQALVVRLAPAVREMAVRCHLPEPGAGARERVQRALASAGLDTAERASEQPGEEPARRDDGYVVLHVGAGDARKAWPTAQWSALVAALAADGWQVVLTGAGAEESRAAAEVARGAGTPRVVNLAGRLDWEALVHLVSRARVVASGDTAVAHVAAACEVPCVVAFTGSDRPERWRPWGSADRVAVLVPEAWADARGTRYVAAGDRRIRVVRTLGVDEMRAAIRSMASPREEHDVAR